jgi:hypothetical protein
MKKQIHPNYIKSSNLIFGAVGLGLINFFFVGDLLNTGQNIAIAILTLVIIAGIGFLVRQGKDWVKSLLVVFMLFGAVCIPFMIITIVQTPVFMLVNIAQTILQLWATILLFKIPKTVVSS